MPHQIALTVRAEILPDQVEELKAELSELNSADDREKLLPFESLPVHFARFVVLDDANDLNGDRIPATVMFMSDVDSPLGDYLSLLVSTAGEGLDRVFRHCLDYPVEPTPSQRQAFLRSKTIRTNTAYVNTVGQSVDQIRGEAELREAIESFVDTGRWSSPVDLWQDVRGFVASRPELAWALRPPTPLEISYRASTMFQLVATTALAIAALPVAVACLPAYLAVLRWHELHDVAGDEVPTLEHLEELEANEDILVQNPLSAVGLVKPGLFRRYTLASVLRVLQFGSRQIYNHGSLAGIETIHFARWVFLDGKRRLIFASSYDGTVESYMDDFIDKVAYGLNAAFSNGVGYPKTSWLVKNGARQEQAFKNFLRVHQIPTQLWYSAYGDLTVRNITENAAIRAGLREELTPKAAAAWAARL